MAIANTMQNSLNDFQAQMQTISQQQKSNYLDQIGPIGPPGVPGVSQSLSKFDTIMKAHEHIKTFQDALGHNSIICFVKVTKLPETDSITHWLREEDIRFLIDERTIVIGFNDIATMGLFRIRWCEETIIHQLDDLKS